MGLSQPVYKAIIRKGYRVPAPIQRKVIDLVKGGAMSSRWHAQAPGRPRHFWFRC